MSDIERRYNELPEIDERKPQISKNNNFIPLELDTNNQNNTYNISNKSDNFDKQCCKNMLFGFIMICSLIIVMISGVDKEYVVATVNGYEIINKTQTYDGSINVIYDFEHQRNHRSIVMLTNYENKTELKSDLEVRFPMKTDYPISKYVANGYVIAMFSIIEIISIYLCINTKFRV
jgi:hypothetical protein